MRTLQLVAHVDHFQHRVMQDALTDADAAYWTRRARTFEAARPRPGDFTGRATRAELGTRDRRLAMLAQVCRQRASVSIWRSGEAA